MDIKAIVMQAVNEGAQGLRDEYLRRDFDTTGWLLNSIKAQGLNIVAKKYIFNLMHGNHPSTFPEYKEGSPLFTWVRIKIAPPERQTQSVSFLVARALYERGDRIARKERAPLDTSNVVPSVKNSISEQLRFELKKYIQNERKNAK